MADHTNPSFEIAQRTLKHIRWVSLNRARCADVTAKEDAETDDLLMFWGAYVLAAAAEKVNTVSPNAKEK